MSLGTSILATISFFFPPFLWITLFITPYFAGIVVKSWLDASLYLPKNTQDNATATSHEDINSPSLGLLSQGLLNEDRPSIQTADPVPFGSPIQPHPEANDPASQTSTTTATNG